ncbi:ABC transporter ATP-binding protein [Glaciibacter superstes]|uniref:ABC transporter ATP-binding protein n=1 Tax=Glaciibacter superstes TaxID=501023 RepID=UPI0003B4108F|nr:ABC transporter ATP-binding protein [Glaciibacter superstes]
MAEPTHHLTAASLAVGYSPSRPVLTLDDLAIPTGRITTLIGSNGSGKSTLLRTIARALDPLGGVVSLDGDDIAHVPRRQLATILSLLPQSPTAPEGLTVRQLCEFGRHPHRGFLKRSTDADRTAVDNALAAAHLEELSGQRLDELSGGQRQRAWIAMCLAQQTPIMLLDEPTTFLDIAHQLEVLDLLHELNRTTGTTIVMVLHDLNHAAQYSDHVIAVADGGVHSRGRPAEVFTTETLREVFDVEAVVIPHPVTGAPLCLPLPRASNAAAPNAYSRQTGASNL